MYEQPPAETTDTLRGYFRRFFDELDRRINSANGVAIRREVPLRPKAGTIYYLVEDLNNVATEGYYVWIDGAWKRLTLEALVP
tara:strand:+ start:735 stop:983 length:249 start_codon:yes stop_codon:yes gene_type:complete